MLPAYDMEFAFGFLRLARKGVAMRAVVEGENYLLV